MARYRYVGGDQRPDVYGVLTPGDVLELDKVPDWGDWETTSKAAERAPTPQPVLDDSAELEPDPPASKPAADTAKEA